jgi:hypothetical protein
MTAAHDFVSQALQEGYGMDEIVAHMSGSKNADMSGWASKWQATAAAPVYGAGQYPLEETKTDRMSQFVAQGQKEQEEEQKKFAKELQGGFEIPSWMKTPEGLTAAGATLYGGFKVGQGVADKLIDMAPKGFKSITERLINKTPEIDRTVDVPMATQPSPVQQAQQKVVDIKNAMAAKGPAPAPQAPVQGIQPPVTPTLTEAIATGQSPTKAIQADLAPLVDEAAPAKSAPPPAEKKKRAPKVQETFKSLADIPPGTTFRPELGNLDRTLFNIVGAEHRRNAMDLLNEGKPFGQVADTNKAISPLLADYWKAVQGQIPETILSRKERENLGVKTEFGNYGGLGRYAKVGGVVGTLLTAAQAANATQEAKQGNTAPAKEMGFDLGTGGLMAALMGLPASALAALGLGSKELATGTLDSPEARALGVRPPR